MSGLGGEGKVQGKEKGLYPIEIPTPFCVPGDAALIWGQRRSWGVFMTEQVSTHVPCCKAGVFAAWLAGDAAGAVTVRDTHGHGCRFWIAITARPLAILSVKLMAP